MKSTSSLQWFRNLKKKNESKYIDKNYHRIDLNVNGYHIVIEENLNIFDRKNKINCIVYIKDVESFTSKLSLFNISENCCIFKIHLLVS